MVRSILKTNGLFISIFSKEHLIFIDERQKSDNLNQEIAREFSLIYIRPLKYRKFSEQKWFEFDKGVSRPEHWKY
jgi:hypothetical protein